MTRLRLKELAEARGLNISQLQRQSGLDMGMVRRYWYNEGTKGPLHEVNLIALAKLAAVLNVHPGELLAPVQEDSEETYSPMLVAA
jgi:transcriptional regulator with XRE-family HTH domain